MKSLPWPDVHVIYFYVSVVLLKINRKVPRVGKILLARLFSVGFSFSLENYGDTESILHMFTFSSL